MNNKLNIRQATVQDIEGILHIARTSFHDTFAEHPQNSLEDLKMYMDENYTVEALSDELADTTVTYLVAEVENQLVGYAKLKQNSSENGVTGTRPVELCRLYNLREFIGKGIGKSLMMGCLGFARENHHDTTWLGVWEHNELAINFYRKFGFEKCGEHVFQFGKDPQTDWLMQRGVNFD